MKQKTEKWRENQWHQKLVHQIDQQNWQICSHTKKKGEKPQMIKSGMEKGYWHWPYRSVED